MRCEIALCELLKAGSVNFPLRTVNSLETKRVKTVQHVWMMKNILMDMSVFVFPATVVSYLCCLIYWVLP